MDQVIGQALATYRRIVEREDRATASSEPLRDQVFAGG